MTTVSQDPATLLESASISKDLKTIAQKVIKGERITFNDGVLLYEKGDLGFVGSLANFVRQKKSGDLVYFNHNFHVEPTNVCVYSCAFCSYSRLIKNREQGWELSVEQILDIIKGYDG